METLRNKKKRTAKELKKIFREFAYREKDRMEWDRLRYLRKATNEICEKYEINRSHLDAMLWAERYEFFTIHHAMEELGYTYNTVRKLWANLFRTDMLYQHFRRSHPLTSVVAQEFSESVKYRVRYALTEKGRMVVREFYQLLETYSQ